jgi:predicted HAD superfamily Cof-like phosphohydrolase
MEGHLTKVPEPGFDPFAAVLEFHRRFGIAVGERPSIPDAATVELRRRLIGEELAEYDAAVSAGDLTEVADALADLAYVIYGAAVSFGIDLRPVFAEVHRTNMAKVGGGERADGKVLKPEGWEPPEIAPLLERMRLGDARIADADRREAQPNRP